jgi:hypothetical protein
MTEIKKKVPLDKIGEGERSVRPKKADDQDLQERIDAQLGRAEVRSLNEANRDSRTNRTMREGYANAVFWYLVGYSVFAAVVVLLDGWKVFGFSLPVAVLTTIVGSTAASAIGLMAIVVTGLFRSQPKERLTSPRRKGGLTPREP